MGKMISWEQKGISITIGWCSRVHIQNFSLKTVVGEAMELILNIVKSSAKILLALLAEEC